MKTFLKSLFFQCVIFHFNLVLMGGFDNQKHGQNYELTRPRVLDGITAHKCPCMVTQCQNTHLRQVCKKIPYLNILFDLHSFGNRL